MFWKKKKSEIEKVHEMYGKEADSILTVFYTSICERDKGNHDGKFWDEFWVRVGRAYGWHCVTFCRQNVFNTQLIFELKQQGEKYYKSSLVPLTSKDVEKLSADLEKLSASLKALEEQDPIKKLLDVVKEDGFDFHWEKR